MAQRAPDSMYDTQLDNSLVHDGFEKVMERDEDLNSTEKAEKGGEAQ